MKHRDRTIRIIDQRRPLVLAELHPVLRWRVERILEDLAGRVTPWEGHRSDDAQNRARAQGRSNASAGQSPHNRRPSRACDLVLDPRYVRVGPHPDDPAVPWLWDDARPAAMDTWAALDRAAERWGLVRVSLRREGVLVRDLPHVELPRWSSAYWDLPD